MEKSENEFLQWGKNWYYVSPEGTFHRITRVYIIANGTHDLCMVKGDKPEELHVKEIAKVEKNDILYVPLGDILWMNITPPYRGSGNSIIMDIGSDKEHTKPLVTAMLKTQGAKLEDRGDQYDTYLGDKYWDES